MARRDFRGHLAALEAKRKADHEFWTFEYLWSPEFRKRYHDFMRQTFATFGGKGTRARIRVKGSRSRSSRLLIAAGSRPASAKALR